MMLRPSFLVTFLTISCMNASPDVRSPGGQRDEDLVSMRSPNIRLTNDNAMICVAYNLTSVSDSQFVVAIEPKPVPRMHDYFMFAALCPEPGYIGPNGDLVPWDCGEAHHHPLTPPLPRAGHCSLQTPPQSLDMYYYQYQDGPASEAGLRLPPGTGIPIGGVNDPKFLVVGFHFPLMRKTLNNMTGVSGLDIRVRRRAPGTRVVHTLNLSGSGIVLPFSVGRISGSWTPDHAVRLLTLYTHWHDMVTRAEVRIERRDGESDLMLDQDPKTFSGILSMSDTPSVHMQAGDRLVIICSYDNTSDQELEVGSHNKCYLMATYILEGDKDITSV